MRKPRTEFQELLGSDRGGSGSGSILRRTFTNIWQHIKWTYLLVCTKQIPFACRWFVILATYCQHKLNHTVVWFWFVFGRWTFSTSAEKVVCRNFPQSLQTIIRVVFGFHGSVHHVDCSKWNQRDAVQQVFYCTLVGFTCFRCRRHPSSGAQYVQSRSIGTMCVW